MIRLMVGVAAVLALGFQPGEKKSPQAFLEGAAQIEGENLRCTITIVTEVPAAKGGKEATEPRITRTEIVAPIKEVRSYVVVASADSPKTLRMIEPAKLVAMLKGNARVYVVNGRELNTARVGDLKEGSIVLMFPN